MFLLFLYKHEEHAPKSNSGSSRDIEKQANRPSNNRRSLANMSNRPFPTETRPSLNKTDWVVYTRANIKKGLCPVWAKRADDQVHEGQGLRDLDHRAQCPGLRIEPHQKLRSTGKAGRNNECHIPAIRDRDCQSLSTLHTIRHQDLHRLPLRHFFLW